MRVLVESERKVRGSGNGFLVVGLTQNFRTVNKHDRDIIFHRILSPALNICTNKRKSSFFYRGFTGRANQYLKQIFFDHGLTDDGAAVTAKFYFSFQKFPRAAFFRYFGIDKFGVGHDGFLFAGGTFDFFRMRLHFAHFIDERLLLCHGWLPLSLKN